MIDELKKEALSIGCSSREIAQNSGSIELLKALIAGKMRRAEKANV